MGVANEAVQMMLLGDAAEHADVGVLVWNAERRYVACNRKACALLGVTRDQLLEKPVGATNRSAEAQEAIAALLAHVPAAGGTKLGETDLGWIVFPTTLAGLEHVIGIFWDASVL
jgi:PAS domain-containing protein